MNGKQGMSMGSRTEGLDIIYQINFIEVRPGMKTIQRSQSTFLTL